MIEKSFDNMTQDMMTVVTVIPYVLVRVPVEAGLFEDKPVFPPFLGEVAFSILLLPQPALTVSMAQVLTGNPPSTGTSKGPCKGGQERNTEKWFA